MLLLGAGVAAARFMAGGRGQLRKLIHGDLAVTTDYRGC